MRLTEPNLSKVAVPDPRFDFLVDKFMPKTTIPAVLTVTDIAGLVRGAASGAGLGNAFLSHIAAVDAIFHMVRDFEDPDVSHVEDSVDPIRDMKIIHDELCLKDLAAVDTWLGGNRKLVDRGAASKELKFAVDTMDKVKAMLKESKDIRNNAWTPAEIEVLNPHNFLTAKPMVYLVNMTKRGYTLQRSAWLGKIQEFVKARGNEETLIPFSVTYETEWADANKAGKEAVAKFEEENNKAKTMFPRIIRLGYKTLQLIYYFTCGPQEVRAWTIKSGWRAPQAAGVIHTDFEKNFIMMEVMAFADFKEQGSEAACKAAGKWKQQGKLYEVADGDIVNVKHGA